MLEAMTKLQEIKNNIRLNIIGTGPEEDSLKKQQLANHLDENIIWKEWSSNDQLPSQLNKADIFVFPSRPIGGWEEQFGYAMAEASACGVPVVATNIGSIGEVVIDGKSGFLVEPNNPQQLAEAINKILSDQELAKRMGEFGREYVVKNFGHKIIAGKILNFLNSR